MPIDSRARAFIEANLVHYRDVTLAVAGFEAEVESVLRSILREFKEGLSAIGIREESASLKSRLSGKVTNMSLKGRATGIEVGIFLQCRDADDKHRRFCSFSFVWVKDPDLRRSLDQYVAAHSGTPFIHEFEESTTYLSAYLDLSTMPQAIDLVHDSFDMLLKCLFGSPEFCREFKISGPVGDGDVHDKESS
jgi:hypothetical protein